MSSVHEGFLLHRFPFILALIRAHHIWGLILKLMFLQATLCGNSASDHMGTDGSGVLLILYQWSSGHERCFRALLLKPLIPLLTKCLQLILSHHVDIGVQQREWEPTPEEKALLREEFISQMHQRFLDGKDKDFNYRSGHTCLTQTGMVTSLDLPSVNWKKKKKNKADFSQDLD